MENLVRVLRLAKQSDQDLVILLPHLASLSFTLLICEMRVVGLTE